DRLDHEVDVAEALVLRRPRDSAQRRLEALVGLLAGQLLLLDQAVELAPGDLARLLEPGVDELLLHVLEHHRDLGRRDHLGDLAAHRAGADYCGFEDEHQIFPPGCGTAGRLSGREMAALQATAGLTLGFRWKTLSGSSSALTRASRS